MSLNEIRNCKYISSVGLLKSLDDLDMITYGDGIVDSPHRVTYDFSKINNGSDGVCIYIKFEYIAHFFNHVFPTINYKFILVTGDGDETLPNDIFPMHHFNQLINDSRIIHWYSVNCIEDCHPKLTLIPIGVNFHSLSIVANFSRWNESIMTPVEQEQEIQNIRDNSLPIDEREIKCYSNFHFHTYPEFGNPRVEAMNRIPRDLVYYEPHYTNRRDTWVKQSEHAFVLSPMGHGMDCHRTWEALILGCIVIVQKSPLDSLYEDLPVLIVDNWEDITQELLHKTIVEFKDKEFNWDKITTRYWVDKIKSK